VEIIVQSKWQADIGNLFLFFFFKVRKRKKKKKKKKKSWIQILVELEYHVTIVK
jgi:hypothetical protein